jgi:2-polyprenyl-3-methyl-5-hydroxy-6-metoxy-1,4-benzoquinol methylase
VHTGVEIRQSDALYTEGEYLRLNPDWHAADSPWKAQQVRSMLARNGLHPTSICEVGCGAGGILKELHDSLPPDVHYVGYEISPQAYELCRSKEAERLHFELADVTKENVRYDLMLVMDVIEHLEDYYTFLRAIRTRATHNILHIPLDLSVQTVLRAKPLLKWRSEVGHLHYFTKETALATLHDGGFDVVDHFLTASAIERPPASRKARLARLPRRLLARHSEDWAARLLGGFSFLVLARST